MKKNLWSAVLIFAIVLGTMFLSTPYEAFASEKSEVKKAYKSYVQELQENSDKTLGYAMINTSKDGMPVLLVSEYDDWDDDLSERNAIDADVYSYSAGKVVFITKMQSTGSGYPLIKKGKYIISGWHHSSQRLTVSGKKGYLESVEGFAMEVANAKCYYKKWTVTNGNKTKKIYQKISMKKAEKMDFYNGGTEILFHKVG
jgi:hypothetical protein